MNIIQLKILELSSRKNIWSMRLREIGEEIGVKNRGLVKYHFDVLIKKKLLRNEKENQLISALKEKIKKSENALLNIPILGAANCGVATLVGEEMFDGYLKVSPGLIPVNDYNNLFAIKAEGNSLNMANIDGQNIESGDYLIIDTNLNPQNGKYVLSIIDGCANIKKFRQETGQIILESESTMNIPPIFIHPSDNYLVNGVVIKVIKQNKGGEE